MPFSKSTTKIPFTDTDVEIVSLFFKARDYFIRRRYILGYSTHYYARLLAYPKAKGGLLSVNKRFSKWIRSYYLPLTELYERVSAVHGSSGIRYAIQTDIRFAPLFRTKRKLLTEHDDEYLKNTYKNRMKTSSL